MVVLWGSFGRDVECDDLLWFETFERSELVVVDRPLASALSRISFSCTSSNVEMRRAVRSGDFVRSSSGIGAPFGLTTSSVSSRSTLFGIGGVSRDTRGVALDEDESRRSVNDRTDAAEDGRSINDLTEAFDLFLECWERNVGRETLSGASSKVSCLFN